MICTFGDTTDVTWWRELDLPVRPVIGRDGRSCPRPRPDHRPTRPRRGRYAELAGKTAKQAQARIGRAAARAGRADGEPRPITHPVKFYEKGDRPLEIVTSRQWYIRNGGRDQDLRDELLAAGGSCTGTPTSCGSATRTGSGPQRRLAHQPAALLRRAVPALVPARRRRRGRLRPPDRPRRGPLPVDPSATCPPGYDEDQRGQPGRLRRRPRRHGHLGHLVADPADRGGWEDDPDLFERVSRWTCAPRPTTSSAPGCSPRSCGPRARLAAVEHAAISGWILDPDRKKMSKSKGNVVTPDRACSSSTAPTRALLGRLGRPGTDTAFDEGQMKIGRRLAIKLLNASKFALGLRRRRRPRRARSPSRSTGRCWPRWPTLVDEATAAFDAYDYARALERTETFFWSFCDDYLELVKGRAYGARATSRRVGQGRAAPRAVDAAAPVRPVPALRHRGGLVVVAGGLGPPRPVATGSRCATSRPDSTRCGSPSPTYARPATSRAISHWSKRPSRLSSSSSPPTDRCPT
jgi:valyl-tRNA synthetase